ncbi:MAG TPA: hypothetical protein VHL11_06120, partial [Phototrophicaceae bacterium]|nr:hypothetical protein [Phototrophicaceae bacterium]
DALNGKMLIDTTNKIGSSPINSLGTLTAHAPQSSIYRAFNMYGWENFENPVFGQLHADLFYCGTDTMARSSVEQLISDVGLHPVYLGGVDQAGLLDDLLKLWFALANGQKMGRQLTFKVLTR